MHTTPQTSTPVAALRRFAQRPAPVERCDMCGLELPPDHPHVVEPATHRMLCACRACALLFSSHQAGRFRQIPDRARRLADFVLTDAQWHSLAIPIDLAFFMRTGEGGGAAALYPSPAGVTESRVSAEDWAVMVEANPDLQSLEPDVQALLVNRVAGKRDHYLVPIDACYRLVGIIRTKWHGFSGGDAVWRDIAAFFEGLTGSQPCRT